MAAIRDGEETMLQVTVAPGTNQRFEFQVPARDPAPAWFVFEVRRGGAVVLTEHDLRGSAKFTVGREPGPPVVVPVR